MGIKHMGLDKQGIIVVLAAPNFLFLHKFLYLVFIEIQTAVSVKNQVFFSILFQVKMVRA